MYIESPRSPALVDEVACSDFSAEILTGTYHVAGIHWPLVHVLRSNRQRQEKSAKFHNSMHSSFS